jgi:hypothetical protein
MSAWRRALRIRRTAFDEYGLAAARWQRCWVGSVAELIERSVVIRSMEERDERWERGLWFDPRLLPALPCT